MSISKLSTIALAAFAATYFVSSHAFALEKYVVRSGAPTPNAANADVYVADKMGYFAEQGLSVEIRYSQNTSQATQLVANGESDAGRFSFESYIAGYEKGMRGKFILPTNRQNLFWIATLESGAIKQPSQLDGKKIGVTNMGSGSLVIAKSILREAGLAPNNSMFVPVGVGPSAKQALETGRVDALSLWDAGYSALERSGLRMHYMMHPRLKNVPSVGVFVSDESLKARRKAHIGFVKALVKARAFMTRHREEAMNIYWEKVPSAKVGESAELQLKNGLAEVGFMDPFPPGTPDNQLSPGFKLNDVDYFLSALKAENVFSGEIKASDIVSNEIVDEIGTIDFSSIVKTRPSAN